MVRTAKSAPYLGNVGFIRLTPLLSGVFGRCPLVLAVFGPKSSLCDLLPYNPDGSCRV